MSYNSRSFEVTVTGSVVQALALGGEWTNGQVYADRAAETGTVLVEWKPSGAVNYTPFTDPSSEFAVASTITLGTEQALAWGNGNVSDLQFTPGSVSGPVVLRVKVWNT